MTAPATGCLDFSCFDSAQPGPSSQQLGGTMWVGDTAQIYAIAWTDCNHYVSTANQKEKFSFVGDTGSVVTMSPTGLVTAVTPGKATILVKTPGGTLSGTYSVTEPIAKIAISFSPAEPVLNDTVTITAEARRADGSVITAATLLPMTMTRKKDGASVPASFLAGATPTLARFVATQDWTYQVVAKSAQRVNRLGRADTASVVVTLR